MKKGESILCVTVMITFSYDIMGDFIGRNRLLDKVSIIFTC